MGTKVKGSVLAEALRKAGLRKFLPSRMDKHALADAAEALLVYAWLNDNITLAETVRKLSATDSPIDDLSQLLTAIAGKIRFSS